MLPFFVLCDLLHFIQMTKEQNDMKVFCGDILTVNAEDAAKSTGKTLIAFGAVLSGLFSGRKF